VSSNLPVFFLSSRTTYFSIVAAARPADALKVKTMARILVIDDNNEVRRMIRQALELHGHNVVDAGDGVQALAQFRNCVTDLVITDIVMPEMEGLETIIELRAMDASVKILAISGGGSFVPDGYLRWAEMLGADRRLEKPFTVQQLVSVVNELLGYRPESAAASGQ
jgi:CheY-like chemotaxis protein